MGKQSLQENYRCHGWSDDIELVQREQIRIFTLGCIMSMEDRE